MGSFRAEPASTGQVILRPPLGRPKGDGARGSKTSEGWAHGQGSALRAEQGRLAGAGRILQQEARQVQKSKLSRGSQSPLVNNDTHSGYPGVTSGQSPWTGGWRWHVGTGGQD